MTGLNPIAGARELLIGELMALIGRGSPNPAHFKARLNTWTLRELVDYRLTLLDSIDEQIGEKINSEFTRHGSPYTR